MELAGCIIFHGPRTTPTPHHIAMFTDKDIRGVVRVRHWLNLPNYPRQRVCLTPVSSLSLFRSYCLPHPRACHGVRARPACHLIPSDHKKKMSVKS